MKTKKLIRLSTFLLFFTFCFGIFCTLCSSFAALGAFDSYTTIAEWWSLIVEGLQNEGVLYLNDTGFEFIFFGFLMISVLSLLAFILALVVYRRDNKVGKKLMMRAIFLFGIAALIVVGSVMIARSSCAEVSPQGNDDTAICTFSLPSGTIPPSHRH